MIEAPGKVVAHVRPFLHDCPVISVNDTTTTQLTATFTTAEGTAHDYDSVCIFSFVEEDGRLKISNLKDFSDPHKRGAFHAVAAKALAKGIA